MTPNDTFEIQNVVGVLRDSGSWRVQFKVPANTTLDNKTSPSDFVDAISYADADWADQTAQTITNDIDQRFINWVTVILAPPPPPNQWGDGSTIKDSLIISSEDANWDDSVINKTIMENDNQGIIPPDTIILDRIDPNHLRMSRAALDSYNNLSFTIES